MREKLLWSLLVLSSIALIASHAQTPAHSESQVGRYQIVVAATAMRINPEIFRLDTVTGKTVVMATTQDGYMAWAAPMQETALPAREAAK